MGVSKRSRACNEREKGVDVFASAGFVRVLKNRFIDCSRREAIVRHAARHDRSMILGPPIRAAAFAR